MYIIIEPLQFIRFLLDIPNYIVGCGREASPVASFVTSSFCRPGCVMSGVMKIQGNKRINLEDYYELQIMSV